MLSKKYRFETKTDAQWAAFFSFLDIDYEYNSNRKMSAGYEPRFSLPKLGLFMDISRNTSEEFLELIGKCTKPVMVFPSGPRMPAKPEIGGTKVRAYNEQVKTEPGYNWCECPYCGTISIARYNQPNLICSCERDLEAYSDKYGLYYSSYLLAAYNFAQRKADK